MNTNLKAGHRGEIKSKTEREEPNMPPPYPDEPYDEFDLVNIDLSIYRNGKIIKTKN